MRVARADSTQKRPQARGQLELRISRSVRTAYEQEGELSAAVELRRLLPGITDNAAARECARTIASWKPLPAAACQITPLRLRRSRVRQTKP
jgi:hypothetical protein